MNNLSSRRFGIGSTLVLLLTVSGCSGEIGFGPIDLNFDCPIFGGPKAFAFSSKRDLPLGRLETSNEVTLECGGLMDIGITDGSYSIDGAAFTSSPGTISEGQRLRLQVRSAETFDTENSADVAITDSASIGAQYVSFRVTTNPGDPANAPTASISSPSDGDLVNTSRISVTGSANDADGIANISVNGVAASSDDGYGTWSADIPLMSGPNIIAVQTADTYLNINPAAAEITINNSAAILSSPADFAIDTAESRLLVLDNDQDILIGISLNTGAQTILSSASIPNSDAPFAGPFRIAVAADGSKAYVIDHAYSDLLVVDLATGIRTVLEDTISPDPGESLLDGRDIALDEAAGSALILVGGLNGAINDTRIISVNLASGERTVLSSDSVPDADNPLGYMFDGMSILFDNTSYRAIVTHVDYLLSVDPLTGMRSVYSDDGVNGSIDSTMDTLMNRALILNRVNGTLYGGNLANGELETLWFVGQGGDAQRVLFDELNNRTLVIYKFSREIYAIDMLTGNSSIAY